MFVHSADLDAVDLIILPPGFDLGDGSQEHRALPSALRSLVGLAIFDQMGEAAFRSSKGIDARP